MIQDIKQDLFVKVPRKICYLRDKIADFRKNSPEKHDKINVLSGMHNIHCMQDIVYFMQLVIHGGIFPDSLILVSFVKLSKPLCILHNDGIRDD